MFARLRQWAQHFATADAATKSALLPEGEALARARYAEMVRLIQADPEQALALALPYRLRQAMPAAFSNFLEHPVSARGSFQVIESSPLPGREAEVPEPFYEVTIRHRTFRAYPYGARLRHKSHSGVPLHGITAYDEHARGHLALSADVVRVLDADEAQAVVQSGAAPGAAACAVCAAAPQASPLAGQQVVGDLGGGEYCGFCQPAHAQQFNDQINLMMSRTWPGGGGTAAQTAGGNFFFGSGTQGTKKLLYMRVTFADDPVSPESADTSRRIVEDNNQYFKDGSYGIVNWLSTVTPPLPLPQGKNYYGEGIGGTTGASVLSDAIAVAASLGYPVGDYNWHYVVFPSLPQALFGGRSDGLLNGGGGAIQHELGHNFGLPHANFIDTSGIRPAARQTNGFTFPVDGDSLLGHEDINAPVRSGKPHVLEYGDIYDVMGSGGGHFNVLFKFAMEWLPREFVRVVTRSETNRIYAFDTPMISTGRLYALVIPKDFDKNYWISVRQGFPNNPWVSGGIEVMWNSSSLTTVLLDTTPGTTPGRDDAAVVVGRTFHDLAARLYITPVAQGGVSSNKWVDVVVHSGEFPDNHPPTMTLAASALNVTAGDTVTFTATAADPDGDAVAYNWDFGDFSFGTNAPVVSKTFATNGHFTVRCEVSDMKGGVVSRHVVVTVGSPATFRMSGRVLDPDGNPVAGVRVHNGRDYPDDTTPAGQGYLYAFTDSEGYYTITGLAPGSYENRAFIYGYRTEPAFLNPQQLTVADATDLDHVATPLPRVSVSRRENAPESGATPGGFILKREGDLSQDLKISFQVGGSAIRGVDYQPLPGFVVTNFVVVTNMEVVMTNQIVVTNSILFMPAWTTELDVDVTAIDNTNGLGDQSVILTLLLATNDFRVVTVFTNISTTNMTGGTPVITTDRVPVQRTNEIAIPGWELLPSGDRETLTFFQTYPTYILAGADATVWISDDDEPALPAVSMVALDNLAVETRGDSATFAFVRSGSLITNDLVIHYSVSGSAINGEDFVFLPGTATIPAGEEYVLVPFIAINDLFVEGTEFATITITPDAAYLPGGGATSVSIEDDDLPTLTIYASDSSAGKAGPNSGRVTVARAGDLSEDLVVNYLVGGTAVSGRDFQPLSQTVTIPANRITADITITPISNAVAGARSVTILISDSPAYNIFRENSATVTIQDALPVVTLTVESATVTEGGGAGRFRVTRAGSTTESLRVMFVMGGSAAEYFDYSPVGTNVIIPAGAASADININASGGYNDRAYENGTISGQETVILQLLPGPDYNLGGTTRGTVRFADNEGSGDLPAVGFMLKESFVREDAGSVLLAVKCTANPATNRPVRLEYRITTGSAVSNVNYVSLSTNGYRLIDFIHYTPPDPLPDFTRSEGNITTINIGLLNDAVVRSNLFFDVQLFYHYELRTNYTFVTNVTMGVTNIFTNSVSSPAPTNHWIGAYPSHRVHLVDVGVTTVSVEAEVPFAYEAGVVPGFFAIIRSGPTDTDLVVAYGVGGTAAGGNDYVPISPNGVSSTVTISAGTNRVFIPVVPIDDPVEESSETVQIQLLNRPGYSGGGSAQVVIVSDDGTAQFVAAKFSVPEDSGVAMIAVQRTGDTNYQLSVDYRMTGGTAVTNTDWRGTNGTLVFAPGETMKSFPVLLVADSVVEPDETVDLVLGNPTGGVPLAGQRTATLEILNDDTAFAFATNAFRANENGGPVAIVVERLGLSSDAVSVTFATTNGIGATEPADYAGTNVLLEFAPGVTSQTVWLPVFDDELFEGDETVLLRLSGPSAPALLGAISNAPLTIVDDECALGFAAVSFSTNEYAPALLVTVVRTGGTINPVSVTLQAVNGSALDGLDYSGVARTLTFNGDGYHLATDGSGRIEFRPGDTSQTISVPLIDDSLNEGDEEFSVMLAGLTLATEDALPGAVAFGAITNAPGVILDNETAGNVDFAFQPRPGPNDRVRALALEPDGKLVFGGDFTEVDGFVYDRISRVQASGVADPFFNPGRGANSNVLAVLVQPDGKILVGGAFTTVDGSNRVGVARLKANGDLDTSFDPGQLFTNGPVRSLAFQADGKAIVGGDFTLVGATNRNRIARLRTDGVLDTTLTASPNNAVNALALQPDGKVLIGGAFTTVGVSTRQRLARLNISGTLDGSLTATIDNVVNSLALQADGKVVVGGAFTNVNATRRPFVVRLMPDGKLDTNFNTGTGPNGVVHSVAVDPVNGFIYIAGDFTTVNGVSSPRIARLLPDGALDAAFDVGTGADATVRAVAVGADGKVSIGGDFTVVKNLPRLRLARLQGGGPAPAPLISQIGLVGGQWTLTFDAQAGRSYSLLISTNLLNWTSVTSGMAAGPVMILIDPTSPDGPVRFYRIGN